MDTLAMQMKTCAIGKMNIFMRRFEHLYIIGNGFDLYHGLPTSYRNFRDYVMDCDKKLVELVDKYYLYSDFWNDFETNLGNFDDDLLREYGLNYLEDYGCDNWRDAFHHDYQYEVGKVIDRIIQGLRKSFIDWLAQISLRSVMRKQIDLDSDAFYLTFNYTQTLEKIYNIPINNILHIHGEYTGRNNDEIIYGHGGHTYIIDKNIEDPRFAEGEGIIKNYFDRTTKPVKQIIHRYRKFFYKMITDVKYVTIIGHSMNMIDYPYFQRIGNSIHRKLDWTYYYHSEKDRRSLLSSLKCRLKIYSDKIHLLPFPL